MTKHDNISYNPIKTLIVRTVNLKELSHSDIYVFDSVIGNETFEITSSRPQSSEEWHHILVRPSFFKTPSYEAMAEIADSFFQDELCMQIIPRRENYISKEKHTLHLWNMKSDCNFNFDEAFNYLFYKCNLDFNFDFTDGICVKHCTDTASHKCIAVITEHRWPSWEELVQAKEDFIGTQVDAVLINRNLAEDLEAFERCKYKIALIWDASSIKLPDKNLV